MVAQILAIVLGVSSFILYIDAFLFPKLHRKSDFIWSGVGFFYALVLWICAGRFTGATLLSQIAGVALITGFVWQTFTLRRQVIALAKMVPLPSQQPPTAASQSEQGRQVDAPPASESQSPAASAVAKQPVEIQAADPSAIVPSPEIQQADLEAKREGATTIGSETSSAELKTATVDTALTSTAGLEADQPPQQANAPSASGKKQPYKNRDSQKSAQRDQTSQTITNQPSVLSQVGQSLQQLLVTLGLKKRESRPTIVLDRRPKDPERSDQSEQGHSSASTGADPDSNLQDSAMEPEVEKTNAAMSQISSAPTPSADVITDPNSLTGGIPEAAIADLSTENLDADATIETLSQGPDEDLAEFKPNEVTETSEPIVSSAPDGSGTETHKDSNPTSETL